MATVKNAVLVQPKVGYMDFFRDSPAVPLNLLYAAALADKEFEIRIVDQRREPDITAAFRRAIDDDTLVVGFTAFTGPMLTNSEMMTELVHTEFPGVPILWGGIHASLMPEQTIADPRIDYVIVGEGEYPLYELLKALRDGTDVDHVKDLYYKKDGRPVKAKGHADYIRGEDIPLPAWHLVDVNQYMPMFMGYPTLNFQASRGCPFACTYCYNTIYNNQRLRMQSTGGVIENLRFVKDKYDVPALFLVDDNFFVNLDWAKEIMAEIKRLQMVWQIQGVEITSLTRMPDDYLRFVSDAGCQRIFIGVDTGSARVRKEVKKPGSVSEVIGTLERVIDNTDFTVMLNFMSSFPGESYDDVKATVDLLFRLQDISPRIRTNPIFIFTPYPGTDLYDRTVEMGIWRPPQSLKEWATEFATGTLEHSRIYEHDPNRLQFYESLHFASQFVDKTMQEVDVSWMLKLCYRMYHPLARYRVRNLNFNMMWERDIGRKVQSFLERQGDKATQRRLTSLTAATSHAPA